jgi:hypothetical protein
VLVAGWAVYLLARRHPPRAVLRDGLVLSGVLLAAGGFWLLRNLALTGNPFYPVKVKVLGITIFNAPRDVITELAGYSVADRFHQPSVLWHQVLPGYKEAFSAPGVAVVAGMMLAVVLSRGTGDRRGCPRLLALAAVAVLLALLYLFLPGGTQGLAAGPLPGIVTENARWLVPAFLLGGGATAAALGRLSRGRALADVLLFAAVMIAVPAELAVSAAGVAVGVAILLVLALAAWRGRSVALVAGALALVLAAAGGYAYQRTYNRLRYAGQSSIVGWIEQRAGSGHRVGIAGYWQGSFVPTYGAFGPRLGNDVSYVGPVVQGQLRFFHRSAPFRRALRAGRYDLLVIGRLEAPDLDHPRPQRTLDQPPEERWAQAEGFREVLRDGTYILLRRQSSSVR